MVLSWCVVSVRNTVIVALDNIVGYVYIHICILTFILLTNGSRKVNFNTAALRNISRETEIRVILGHCNAVKHKMGNKLFPRRKTALKKEKRRRRRKKTNQ